VGIKIDFGNNMIVEESLIEDMADVSIEAIAKAIPKEYLCTAVLNEILKRAEKKAETMLISFSRKYPE